MKAKETFVIFTFISILLGAVIIWNFFVLIGFMAIFR